MIPENKIGNFKIVYERNTVALYQKSSLWMELTTREKAHHQDAIEKIEGRVLVGGLGLGYIVEEFTKKPEVTEIIVVEIAQEVVDLVWQYIDTSKSKIVIADIFDYLKKTDEKFDWVYLDCWFSYDRASIRNYAKPLIELTKRIVPENRVWCWRFSNG